uniref:Uncharacterized protein n=1 Tax=Macaca fascicularis TaxID=9541 RepID=A0A7N9CLJ7_MACFA
MGTCHHTWVIFVLLVETGFHHVGQVGLELLTPGNPPVLPDQSAGITGVSHCAQSQLRFLRQLKVRTICPPLSCWCLPLTETNWKPEEWGPVIHKHKDQIPQPQLRVGWR